MIEDACGAALLGTAADTMPAAPLRLRIYGPGFYRAVAANGSVGAGEAYMEGYWDCDDLVGLVRLLVRNRDLLDGMEGGWRELGGLAMRAWHAPAPQHA